jgi:hypothetical protein
MPSRESFHFSHQIFDNPQRKMFKMKKPTADLDISSQIASN